MSSRKDLAERLFTLKQSKRKLKEEEKSINEEISKIEEDLVLEMEHEDLRNFKTSNGTFYLRGDAYASIESKDEFFSFLKDQGMDNVIEHTVHNSRLRAIVKEYKEETGLEIPGVKAHYITKIGIRNNNDKGDK